ncbi:Hypothetical_protein [Hexamita inflata]|uniref:Hypothetical_protein n=1 Tax=Hexamita inflata TaxID=28002 RepID=A0AA86U766_9EUKA|nr:Hypothetical protein HINF_LOCUS31364 [Hexamita inflata]
MEYQKQFIQQQRAKEDIKAAKPRKKLIYHRQYTSKLGICKIKQTKKEPRNLIKLMKPISKATTKQCQYIEPTSRANRMEQRATRTRQNWSEQLPAKTCT